MENQIIQPEADCARGAGVCANEIYATVHNITSGYYVPVPLGHVSNHTACVDGFINGYNHVCDPVKAKRTNVDCPSTAEDNQASPPPNPPSTS